MLAWLYYLLIDAMIVNLEVSTFDNSDKYPGLLRRRKTSCFGAARGRNPHVLAEAALEKVNTRNIHGILSCYKYKASWVGRRANKG